jgi:hypothetical protein
MTPRESNFQTHEAARKRQLLNDVHARRFNRLSPAELKEHRERADLKTLPAIDDEQAPRQATLADTRVSDKTDRSI